MYMVTAARPVWGEHLSNEFNQFLGFHTRITYDGPVRLAIAARSYYRLYIDGKFVCSGPARTAEHYCRVDEIHADLSGTSDIAIEVAAISKPEKYCNDCTMEPGLLLCEITNESGNVLSATGDTSCSQMDLLSETQDVQQERSEENGRRDVSEKTEGEITGTSWSYTELSYRRSLAELMSHSRGVLEYYDLTPQSYDWMYGKGPEDSWRNPAVLEEKVQLLERHTPYPTYQRIPMDALTGLGDIIGPENSGNAEPEMSIARFMNPSYFAILPEENCFTDQLKREKTIAFSGTIRRPGGGQIVIAPGEHPVSLVWERRESELGFIDFDITVREECTVDIINSDHRSMYGLIRGNTYASRYHLQPGTYHLTTFEPKLTRYIKMILRTSGEVQLSQPVLLEYTYPDDHRNYFSCSDGDLNRIYDGARRTLRLNSLDIYMDCPQRERGGWLCDSQFNGPGSWMMFGDLSVERDFIENFMLTDPDVCWKGFFPEVYPGVHRTPEDVGIRNWSFWLITELYDYYHRSGDREFIDQCENRVDRFITGMLSLRGESGLIENLGSSFVDWSLSNQSFALEPISIPNNCLAVCLLERASELYGRQDWKEAADQMRSIIEALPLSKISFIPSGDAGIFENGQLRRGNCRTEAGMALELWCGFHLDDKSYIQKFVNALGTTPEYRPNPNVGRSNLFIGLMIRFEVLARLGRIEQLVKEWKDIYLQELRDGSGTFFENIHGLSGCHAFNSETGALIVNHVLGLGSPMQYNKTVVLNPHPARLRWANGTAYTPDGTIFMEWSSEPDDHKLDIRLQLPETWTYVFDRPFELSGWQVTINGQEI